MILYKQPQTSVIFKPVRLLNIQYYTQFILQIFLSKLLSLSYRNACRKQLILLFSTTPFLLLLLKAIPLNLVIDYFSLISVNIKYLCQLRLNTTNSDTSLPLTHCCNVVLSTKWQFKFKASGNTKPCIQQNCCQIPVSLNMHGMFC